MDERAFGELTRHIAAAPSRRGMLRALGGGMAATVMATLGRRAPAGAEEVWDEAICRPQKFPCGNKLQCCARKCTDGVCGCLKKGKDCIRGLGFSCCTSKCTKKGKCS